MGINIQGLIYTQKMSVDGITVDFAKTDPANTSECNV